MAQKKKRQNKAAPGRKPPRAGQGVRLAFAILFLCGFLVTSLILIARVRESYRPPVNPQRVETLLADARVEVENTLLRAGLTMADMESSQRGELTLMQARGDLPKEELLRQLSRRLQRLSPRFRLLVARQQRLIEVSFDDRPRLRLEFRRSEPPVPADTRPAVAIIMDDLGGNLGAARNLLATGLPVTFSVLPNTRHAAETATLAHRYGREVMIHLPMEPLGYPAANPGRDALMVDLPDEELRSRFLHYLEVVPYAVGGNNHMGSRFTADARGMRVILELMKAEGLFFVDSRTSGASVAGTLARKLGVPSADRDVFLDNRQDVAAIEAQVDKLVARALKRGRAIGICHPYPETIQALANKKDLLQNGRIRMVAASRLIR
ncbi:MAG: divergent polysaccharide deacetylase family protein [Deltaproteobacteria bacterium]|nr:MAG: divergent polysaccharide deacetylase family protein [Deltaproteobacteria bacterium]